MHELLDGIVDLKSLKKSKELQNSIEDDNRRASINSAKFRAAAQNVDYPAFAALVSCAHLKPMERRELDSQKSDPKSEKCCTLTPPAWSFDPRGKDPSALSGDQQGSIQPKNESCSALSVISDSSDPPSSSFPDSHIHDEGTKLSCFRNPLFEKDGNKFVKCLHGHGKTPNATQILNQGRNSEFSSSFLHGDEKRKKHDNYENSQSERGRLGYPIGNNDRDCNAYTSDTFIKEWRKRMTQGNIECLTFMSFLSLDIFPAIFEVEIPPFLLEEILEALAQSIFTLANEKDAKQNLNLKTRSHIQFDAGNCRRVISKWVTCLDKASKGDLDFSVSSLAEEAFPPKVDQLEEVQDRLWLAIWIASILEALTLCGRFELSLKVSGQKTLCNAVIILNFIYKNLMN